MNYQCIIVGLGPVGALLANSLGNFGIKTAVLEKEETIYPYPRAIHGDDETLRIFQSIGLLEEILPKIQFFDEMRLEKVRDENLLSIELTNPKEPYAFPADYWFYQPEMEKILRDRLNDLDSVDIFLASEAKTIQQNENGVRIQFAQNGVERELTAEFLVGCDGAKSWVRKKAGIELKDLGFEQKWLVVDAFLKPDKKAMDWGKTHRQICDPEQPITYLAGVGNHRRWEFMMSGELQPETAEKAFQALNISDFCSIQRKQQYQFHALIAKKWQENNILLCGDSAHQMPPFLGQGLCSGFRDAHNLAWKLDYILNKNASREILKSYQSEQAPHTLNLIKGTMILGRIIQTKNTFLASIRNGLLRIVGKSTFLKKFIQRQIVKKDPLKNGLLGKNRKPVAGSLFIQKEIIWKGEEILSDELLGNHFTLISSQSVQIQESFPGLKQIVITNDDAIPFQEWLKSRKVDFVLVRPDKYIFDAGKIKDLPKVLECLKKQLNCS